MIAAINAFNMLDGMDGLAGALSLIALTSIAFLAGRSGNTVALSISLIVAGAVTAFLIANIPITFNRKLRCFMGDSGSTLLGISVAWLCISVTQDSASTLKPVTALWIVAIPLFDLCWTVTRRSIRGIPPFRSDQGHFHHMVQQAGVGVQKTFALLITLAMFLAAFGIGLEWLGVSDFWSFLLLIFAGILTVNQLHHPSMLLKLAKKAFRQSNASIIGKVEEAD